MKLLQSAKLTDSWGQLHNATPTYTYYDKKSNSYSRLDYIFKPNNANFEAINIEITQPIKNQGVIDHSAVKLVLNTGGSRKGPGYWKLNNAILCNEDYLKQTKNIIKNTTKEYESLKSYQLIWEMIKINVKEFTISYCKNKAKERSLDIQNIQNELDLINRKILNLETSVDISNEEKNNITALHLKKSELESKQQYYYNLKQKGQFVRARVQWIKNGEIPSKYFLSLEKQRQAANVLTKITKNDTIIDNDREILNETLSFYEKLYEAKHIPTQHIDEYFKKVTKFPTLTLDGQKLCEKTISIEEITCIVKNLKTNKSPGADGLTSEFYQTFWQELKLIFMKILIKSFEKRDFT